MQDSFTNALSFVGLWALARKYIEVLVVSLELYASVRCEKQIISGKKFA